MKGEVLTIRFEKPIKLGNIKFEGAAPGIKAVLWADSLWGIRSIDVQDRENDEPFTAVVAVRS